MILPRQARDKHRKRHSTKDRFVADPSWSGDVGSVVDLPPHSATLGLRFYDGEMFPIEFRGRAFYAEHGSWDRREGKNGCFWVDHF